VVDDTTEDDELIFQMNINGSNSNSMYANGNGSSTSPAAVDDGENKNEVRTINIEKMDEMMSLLFQYLSLVRSNNTLCDEVFNSLLRVFDTAILRTHKVHPKPFLSRSDDTTISHCNGCVLWLIVSIYPILDILL
jgi:hypothetical protein